MVLNNIIQPSLITSTDLKNGKYKDVLPEYYELKTVSENNAWHLEQNVFNHVVAVFAGLEDVLKFSFLNEQAKRDIEDYLNQKVSKYTRKDLLIISTILHDIAKTKTLIKNDAGNTSCPGHELIGALMTKDFFKRFKIDEKDGEYVERIVHYHGFISDILSLSLATNQKDYFFDIFKNRVRDVYKELILLMYADLKGCDLKKSSPDEYIIRENLLIEFLKKD